MQVLDGPQLDVKQVPHLAVRIGGITDAIKLQIGNTQTRFGGLPAELGALRKLNAVCSRLHADVAQLARIPNCIQKIRRQSRLSARKLDRHLPPGLDGDRVIEERLDLLPGQFVDKSHLVGVHKARVTHHVAAVGEVNG